MDKKTEQRILDKDIDSLFLKRKNQEITLIRNDIKVLEQEVTFLQDKITYFRQKVKDIEASKRNVFSDKLSMNPVMRKYEKTD